MTEDEAKTKTCHKTLVPREMPGGAIGPYFVQTLKPCIGSACMAWRAGESKPAECSTLEAFGLTLEDWYGAFLTSENKSKVQEAVMAAEVAGWYPECGQTLFLGMGWRICRGSIAQGFCGLAGKP